MRNSKKLWHIGITLVFLFIFSIQLNAFSFSDNFNRNDNSSIGNGWLVHAGGTQGISDSKMVIDNGTSESIGDNFAYYNLGKTLDQALVTGVISFSSCNHSFYIGINATAPEIQANPYKNYWSTSGKGYGFELNTHTDEYFLMDNTSLGNYANPSTSLQAGSFALNHNQDYNFELNYKEDKSLEVRFWAVGGSRPSTASFQYTPGTLPSYSGKHIAFGITDEGTLYIDDLLVTTSIPEPSSLFLLGSFLLAGVIFSRKK